MKAKTNQDFSRERLSNHFVYESFDEKNHLFFNRGSIGFVLHGLPLVGTTIYAQNEISEYLKEESNIPKGSSMQVAMIGTSNIDLYLKNWSSLRKDEIFKTLASYRTEFLKKLASDSGIIKDVFLLISITIPTKKFNAENIINILKKRDILKNTLKSIGLITYNVDSRYLFLVIRDFLEHQREYNQDLNHHETLSSQLIDGDFKMEVESDMLTIHNDNKQKSIVALEVANNKESRPSLWSLPLMDLFLGDELKKDEQIKSDFIISFTLEILDKQSLELSKTIAKRETLAKNIKSGLSKWIPGLEEEYNDINDSLKELQAGSRAVIINQNVILKDNKNIIYERVQEYRSMLRRAGFNFIPCSFDHLPVFLSCLPMQTVEMHDGVFKSNIKGLSKDLYYLGRGIKTVSSESKAILPIIGEWKGDLRSPGFILSGRRGQIMYWSPFGPAFIPGNKYSSSSNENFNLCIAGVPGSGKSVFMQELMISTIGIGGKVFVLDYGRSFKHTCQILKGSYIEFDIKNPISLNPFSEVSEKEEDHESREDALSSIATVINSMAAPIHGTTDLQNAMIQKAIRGVWKEKKSKSEITDIASWLLRRNETYAKDLGNMLFPFTREGIYGQFFKGKANLSLNHNIVVIETDHLRNIPALLTVIVQMMIVHINQTMVKGDRKYPSLIMIDEAWKLLQGKSSGAFIEEAGRIARKYKASITLATQQLTDYFRSESPAAEKAFENSAWKVILKQNPESLIAMRNNPKLKAFVNDDYQLKLMQSVSSNPPEYSEMAIYGMDVKCIIARLMLDPFTLLLTSTNPEEYTELEKNINNGMSVTDSIKKILNNKNKI